MLPAFTTSKNTLIQWVITLFLVLVLGSIVAGYIYYGMLQAKKFDTAVVKPSVEVPILVPASDEITKRAFILESLAKQSTSIITQEERAVILEEIVKESKSDSSEADRMKILEALSPVEVSSVPTN